MARVLRRPMFRLGGNTDQGIMSGVAPRQGYEHGGDYGERISEKAREKEKVMRELIGQRPDRSLSNFMIDFGLDIASRFFHLWSDFSEQFVAFHLPALSQKLQRLILSAVRIRLLLL